MRLGAEVARRAAVIDGGEKYRRRERLSPCLRRVRLRGSRAPRVSPPAEYARKSIDGFTFGGPGRPADLLPTSGPIRAQMGSLAPRRSAGGNNYNGQSDVPELQLGARYEQVSAGSEHTVLLRCDGMAVAFGSNRFGQCNVPELEIGAS